MNPATLGVLVPIVAIIAGVVIRWLRIKERQIEVATHESAEKAARYAAQTDRLEQRVRVLERIVTEKGMIIADEIDKLRDDHHVDRTTNP